MRKSYLFLSFMALVSLIASLHLMIKPETVSLWVIRFVGVWWFIEFVNYSLSIYLKFRNKKRLTKLKAMESVLFEKLKEIKNELNSITSESENVGFVLFKAKLTMQLHKQCRELIDEYENE